MYHAFSLSFLHPQALQAQIAKLREEEEKLRWEMADTAQQGADATSAYAGPQHDDRSGAHAADLQEDLELTQNARLFAECLAVRT